jgi:aspartate racemase
MKDVEQQDGGAMKTIGILGGLGPQATMDFETRLHHTAQTMIAQHENGGYPPMVVYYHRHPPFLLKEDRTPKFPLQADPRLLEGARRLGAWADFLVIVSNRPHLLQEQIEQASGREVLSMIQTTLAEVRRRGWRSAGVLAFGDPGLYSEPLRKMGVRCETVNGDPRMQLNREIMKVMEGRNDGGSTLIARQAVKLVRDKKVDGIILGCTEIPLLLAEHASDADLLNPAQLLAEAALRRAIG